jgi:Sec-independent protein translocase protein TatA
MPDDTKGSDLKDWALKATIWVIPVVFGAGTLTQIIRSDGAGISALEEKVDDAEQGLYAHSNLPGHPVSTTQIQHLTEQQDEMMIEQRGMRVEQRDMAMDLAAICQATGADCSR